MTGDAAAAALPAAWFAHDEDGRMVDAPCRIDPRLWDTDRAPIHEITATGRRSDGTVPELAGMVWAGRAYSKRGVSLDVDGPAARTANRPDHR